MCEPCAPRLCKNVRASSTAMCICVRLQDEKPSRADPKYVEKACIALLKQVENGQEVTRCMLQKETQRCFRRDYKAWNKRKHAKKMPRARDENDQKLLLTDLGFGDLNVETRSSPPPLENSWQRAHSPPPSVARSPEPPSAETPSSYLVFH